MADAEANAAARPDRGADIESRRTGVAPGQLCESSSTPGGPAGVQPEQAGAELSRGADEIQELLALEREEQSVRVGGDRRRAGRAVKQADLTEHGVRPELAQDDRLRTGPPAWVTVKAPDSMM